MMARKRKKIRCSNDGDFRLRGRRFWRDENDGDSVPMTESWQVCQIVIDRGRRQVPRRLADATSFFKSVSTRPVVAVFATVPIGSLLVMFLRARRWSV